MSESVGLPRQSHLQPPESKGVVRRPRNEAGGRRSSSDSQGAEESGDFDAKVIRGGFTAAIVVAVICLAISATILLYYLIVTSNGVSEQIKTIGTGSDSNDFAVTALNARLVTARLGLLSCGMSVGMSFGFLGFALFLMGIHQGNIKVDGKAKDTRVQIANLSPGAFVILCASCLIAACALRQTPFSHDVTLESPGKPAPSVEHTGSTTENRPINDIISDNARLLRQEHTPPDKLGR